jgi:hypothetical protein
VLKEAALATSLAVLTGLLYVSFLVLGAVAPGLFRFLLNAQFLGADVASLFAKSLSAGHVLGTLVT